MNCSIKLSDMSEVNKSLDVIAGELKGIRNILASMWHSRYSKDETDMVSPEIYSDEYISTEECAKRLGVTDQTIRNWILQGKKRNKTKGFEGWVQGVHYIVIPAGAKKQLNCGSSIKKQQKSGAIARTRKGAASARTRKAGASAMTPKGAASARTRKGAASARTRKGAASATTRKGGASARTWRYGASARTPKDRASARTPEGAASARTRKIPK